MTNVQRTPEQRRKMRACALHVLAESIREAARNGRADGKITRKSGWGEVDEELRRDVRLLFGMVASYADDLASTFEAGTRRLSRRGRGARR